MRFKLASVIVTLGTTVFLSACAWNPPLGQAYWQRVEADSALWMRGPKAQQQLEQDIATCVREVDELVTLDALRETTPPDTHGAYQRALKASGDLDYYDTPTRLGDHKVAHTDYHDYESCMRTKGWERVNYVRYQAARQSQDVYQDTRSFRKWGVPSAQGKQLEADAHQQVQQDFQSLNR